jgi:hypothetical protein
MNEYCHRAFAPWTGLSPRHHRAPELDRFPRWSLPGRRACRQTRGRHGRDPGARTGKRMRLADRILRDAGVE